FFQAEDGIRDFHVTGVQTCALPISLIIVLLLLAIPCLPRSHPALHRRRHNFAWPDMTVRSQSACSALRSDGRSALRCVPESERPAVLPAGSQRPAEPPELPPTHSA